MKVKVTFVVFILLLFVSSNVFAQGGLLTPKQIGLYAQSVVQIVSLDADGVPIAGGSGTIVTSSGHIYTNRHVLFASDNLDLAADFAIYITGDTGERPVHRYYAKIEGVSPYNDIDFALLKIDRDKFGRPVDEADLNLPYIQEGATVTHGEYIYVFGYPGLGQGLMVVTQGTITTIENGNIGDDRLPVWYQTDAEISPGNSGGLALNNNGEFIGIPSAAQFEQNTGGRLGGILPFTAISATMNDLITADEWIDLIGGPSPTNNRVPGFGVDCGRLGSFDNGVRVTVIGMRAGFQYTATAIGIDGFDPVLAVLDTSSGTGTCVDNEPNASYYTVTLPSVDGNEVRPSNTTAQVRFSQNTGQQFANQSLLVGGKDSMSGEFILILEGMAVTAADGLGDPFRIDITPGMVGYGIPLTIYQLATTRGLDTFLHMVYVNEDDEYAYVTDGEDAPVYCDNAGGDCWGSSVDLSNTLFTQSGRETVYHGSSSDSLLFLNLEGLSDRVNEQDLGTVFWQFLMGSQSRSTGNYTVIVHAGTL